MIDTHYLKDETLWNMPYSIKAYVVDDLDCVEATQIVLGEIDDHPEIKDVQLMIGDIEGGYTCVSFSPEEARELAKYLLLRVEFQKAQT